MVDDLYTRTTGKFIEGKTELDLLSKQAIIKLFRRRADIAVEKNDFPELDQEQKAAIRKYYKGCARFSLIYHRVYAGRVGHLDLNYMPDELYYGYIEPYYNDREAARYIDNKAMYYRYFPTECLPKLTTMRMGSIWYDAKLNPIPAPRVLDLIRENPDEMVLKIAENSEGGAGVFFLDRDDPVSDFRKRMRYIDRDVVVQESVKQHGDYAVLHPQSVNSIRVMSFLHDRGVDILTTCVKTGVGGCRTDNLSSGGMLVGVRDNGVTGDLGAMHDGIVTREHPTLHYVLAGHPVSHIDKAHELVRKLHPIMGKFRLASWDIVITEDGRALLLETNVSLTEIADMQVCAGPLFGDKTRKICREVFGL